MPDRSQLTKGDMIRLVHVPESDIQAANNYNNKQEGPDTVGVLTHLIKYDPLVTIDMIDEYGNPWFSATIQRNGEEEYHTIAIMDDDSWDFPTK